MPFANSTDGAHERDEFHFSAEEALGSLSRHLAHDFNNIWATIFGLTQKLSDQPEMQNREEVIGKINLASSHGLLYSRSVMGVLQEPALVEIDEFDLCAAVREWSYRTGDQLANSIDLSCLVPPHPIMIKFNRNALHLILLAFIGYALRSNEPKRWAMIGVRSVVQSAEKSAQSAECADIMLLCKQPEGTAYPRDLQQRIEAIREVSRYYGGTVESWMVTGVGVNSRIRLPMHAAEAAPA